MSHENTITVEVDGKHFVLPTVHEGKQVNDVEAFRLFREGKLTSFGEFKTRQEANDYARNRSNSMSEWDEFKPTASTGDWDQFEKSQDWSDPAGRLGQRIVKNFSEGVDKIKGSDDSLWQGAGSLLTGMVSGPVDLLDRTVRAIDQLDPTSPKQLDPDISRSKMAEDLDKWAASKIGANPESPVYQGTREAISAVPGALVGEISDKFGPGAGLASELGMLGMGFGAAAAFRRGRAPQATETSQGLAAQMSPEATSTPPTSSRPLMNQGELFPEDTGQPPPTSPYWTEGKKPLDWQVDENGMPISRQLTDDVNIEQARIASDEDYSIYKNPEEYGRQLELQYAARHENAETRRMVEERLNADRRLEELQRQVMIEDAQRKAEMEHDYLKQDQSIGKTIQENQLFKQHELDLQKEQIRKSPENTALAEAFKKAIEPVSDSVRLANVGRAKKQGGSIGDFVNPYLTKLQKEVLKATDDQLETLRDQVENQGVFSNHQTSGAFNIIMGELQNRYDRKRDLDMKKAHAQATKLRQEFPKDSRVLHDGKWATVTGWMRDRIGIVYRDPKFKDVRIWVNPRAVQKPLGQIGPGKKQGGWVNPFSSIAKKELPTDKLKEVYGLNKDVSTADFLHTIFKDLQDTTKEGISKLKDIPYKFHLSSASFRTTNPLIQHIKDPVLRVAHHLDQKIKESLEWVHLQNAKYRDAYKAYNNYFLPYGKKGKFTARVAEFKQDMKMLLEWEKNPELWRVDREWYPSVEKMVELGMPENRAKIWRGMFDASEAMWTTLENAIAGTTLRLPPRIPMWMPHVFKGPYGVKVYTLNEKGDKVYKAEYNAYTRGARDEQYKHLQKQIEGNNEGLLLEKGEPSAFGNELHDILQGVYRAHDIVESNKGLSALLQQLYESSAKGVIGHALQREHPTKAGHLLERVNEDGNVFGLSQKDMKDAIKLMQNSHEAINNWAARISFLNKTWLPIEASGFFELPKLRNASRAYLESYLNIPNTIFKEVDIKIRDSLIWAGWNPTAAHHISEMINSGLAKYYLVANPAFYTVNALQSTISVPVLMAHKSFAQLHGQATGSVTKALADMRKDLPALVGWNQRNNNLFNYANDRGILDPVGQEVLDPGQFKDPVALTIERKTRFASFLAGYHYYKQFMTDVEAKRMAGLLSKEVSVPYERMAGAPVLFNKLPIVGRPLAMFWTYQQHMLGLLNQHRSLVQQAVQTKNPKALANSIGAMLGTQSMNIALFGLAGHAFSSNWNDIASFFNRWMNTEIPTTDKLARTIDNAFNLNGQMQFGLVSKSLGYDVSTSATGVGYNLPGAYFNGMTDLFSSALLAGKWLSGKEVTKKEIGEDLRTKPKQLQGLLEPFVRGGGTTISELPVIGKFIEKGVFDTTVLPDWNKRGDPRSKTDQWVRFLGGLKSLDEAALNTSERIHKLDEQRINREIEHLHQLLKENGPNEEYNRKLIEFSLKYGQNPRTTMRAVIRYQIDNEKTPEERRMKGLSTPRGAGRAERYLEERAREPNR